MSAHRPLVLAALTALCLGPLGASAYDAKAISPSICQPFAPDTTAAEIEVTQVGIYNPGTSIEKVICALPRDSEVAYSSLNGLGNLAVYYRVLGAAPGRLTCTVFVGTSTMHWQSVATATASGDLVSGGNRGYLTWNLPAQSTTIPLVPNTLVCAISPKTSLGAIYLRENGLTDESTE
jgi:hypothetical protein